MLWIWLLARNSVKWETGPLDRYFTFLCAHCGGTMAAMVRAFGFGSASNLLAAQHGAHRSADAFAQSAVAAAACPHCSAVQPAIHASFAAAAKKADRRRMLRIPLAAAAALVLAIILAFPAIRDLRHSIALAVVATSAAAAVGSLIFAIFSRNVLTPSTNPSGVWFSHDPSQGPLSWFPARPGHVPIVVAQPAAASRVLSLVTLGVTGITAIVAIIAWTETFRKVYVVSAEGPSGDLAVRIDGAAPVHAKQSGDEDAANVSFEVRTDSKHTVVVTDTAGEESSYELDPKSAKHGWAIAPHSREHGLCLTNLTWYYGTKPKDAGEDALLNKESDLVVLPHSYDVVFTPPPATVQVENGSSATRTTLRALECASLARENIVPFKKARWSR